MIGFVKRLARHKRGSTLIEFAFISPVLIMFMLASLEFGQALRADAGLRDLVGDVGRQAVVSWQLIDSDELTKPDLEAMIRNRAKQGKYNLTKGALNPVVDMQVDTTLLTVRRVRIVVSYDHLISIPLLPQQTIRLTEDRTFFIPLVGTSCGPTGC